MAMKKLRVNIAIAPELNQWFKDQANITGISISGLMVSRSNNARITSNYG